MTAAKVLHAIDGDGSAVCDATVQPLLALPTVRWADTPEEEQCQVCIAVVDGHKAVFAAGLYSGA